MAAVDSGVTHDFFPENHNDGDNSNYDDNADWRQVSKGRRAATHTDERRVTPVRNQFQELSEQ
jgi:hypothetical protein